MMIKVSKLTGAQLDYYVAKAGGRDDVYIGIGGVCRIETEIEYPQEEYRPSTEWAQGGPLIGSKVYGVEERCNTIGPWSSVAVRIREEDRYEALEVFGDTPLQAICRAVVRAAFGDEVEEVAC